MLIALVPVVDLPDDPKHLLGPPIRPGDPTP
jgi:hypothetical protein